MTPVRYHGLVCLIRQAGNLEEDPALDLITAAYSVQLSRFHSRECCTSCGKQSIVEDLQTYYARPWIGLFHDPEELSTRDTRLPNLEVEN